MLRQTHMHQRTKIATSNRMGNEIDHVGTYCGLMTYQQVHQRGQKVHAILYENIDRKSTEKTFAFLDYQS